MKPRICILTLALIAMGSLYAIAALPTLSPAYRGFIEKCEDIPKSIGSEQVKKQLDGFILIHDSSTMKSNDSSGSPRMVFQYTKDNSADLCFIFFENSQVIDSRFSPD